MAARIGGGMPREMCEITDLDSGKRRKRGLAEEILNAADVS